MGKSTPRQNPHPGQPNRTGNVNRQVHIVRQKAMRVQQQLQQQQEQSLQREQLRQQERQQGICRVRICGCLRSVGVSISSLIAELDDTKQFLQNVRLKAAQSNTKKCKRKCRPTHTHTCLQRKAGDRFGETAGQRSNILGEERRKQKIPTLVASTS